jgi:hypothetical protein
MKKAQMFSKISNESQEFALVHNEFGRTMSRAQVSLSFCNTCLYLFSTRVLKRSTCTSFEPILKSTKKMELIFLALLHLHVHSQIGQVLRVENLALHDAFLTRRKQLKAYAILKRQRV